MSTRGRPRRGRPRNVVVPVTGIVFVLLALGGPVYGAGPLDNTPLASTAVGEIELPSLPVAVPSVVIPTLPPVPTIRPTLPPVPTIRPTLPPLPTPTLPPLPTPTLPPPPTVPPSLPILSASPTPRSSSTAPTASDPNATGGDQGGASSPPGGKAAGSADPSTGNIPVGGPLGPHPSLPPMLTDGPSAAAIPSIGQLIVPGLLVGIPLLTLLLILAGQIGVGAAWLPVVRRWLTRPLVPGHERAAADLPGDGSSGDATR